VEINWAAEGVDTRVVKRCGELRKAELKPELLELELARLSLEFLEEFHYEEPPDVPKTLEQFHRDKDSDEWYKKTPQEKTDIIKRIFDKQVVKDYFEKCGHVAARNLSNVKALEGFIFSFMKAEDKVSGMKVWKVYQEYPNVLSYTGEKVVWRKIRDFRKRLQQRG